MVKMFVTHHEDGHISVSDTDWEKEHDIKCKEIERYALMFKDRSAALSKAQERLAGQHEKILKMVAICAEQRKELAAYKEKDKVLLSQREVLTRQAEMIAEGESVVEELRSQLAAAEQAFDDANLNGEAMWKEKEHFKKELAAAQEEVKRLTEDKSPACVHCSSFKAEKRIPTLEEKLNKKQAEVEALTNSLENDREAIKILSWQVSNREKANVILHNKLQKVAMVIEAND